MDDDGGIGAKTRDGTNQTHHIAACWVRTALRMGAVGFDAIKHLVLCWGGADPSHARLKTSLGPSPDQWYVGASRPHVAGECTWKRRQIGGNVMHAVTRFYSGPGAKELFDLLAERKDDVEAAMRKTQGFVSYTLVATDDGGISVTVCQDKAGTDDSLRRAREWIQTNAAKTSVSPPAVSEGKVILNLS